MTSRPAVQRTTTLALQQQATPDICAFCKGKPSGLMVPCQECYAVKYCSLLHRNSHRDEHKQVCAQLRKERNLSPSPKQSSSPPSSQTAKEVPRPASLSGTSSLTYSPLSSVGPSSPSKSVSFHTEAQQHLDVHPPSQTSVSVPTPATGSTLFAAGEAQTAASPRPHHIIHQRKLAPSPAPASPPHTPTKPPTAAAPVQPESPGSVDFAVDLGRAAWKVLHSLAEQYPRNPTHEQMDATLQFLRYFALIYPCEKCRIGFQTIMQQFPPDVSSQPAFITWMSLFHDQVNIKLGKPTQAAAYLTEKGLPVPPQPFIQFPLSPQLTFAPVPLSPTFRAPSPAFGAIIPSPTLQPAFTAIPGSPTFPVMHLYSPPSSNPSSVTRTYIA